MRREELGELHCITPIANLGSILAQGILSHKRAANVPHHSVAMPEIQERRKRVTVPSGRPLHDYANLYINARNKMMYKLKCECGDLNLCVLKISTEVLDLPHVVIADRNASSDYVRFAGSPEGLSILDRDLIFADSWTHPDDYYEERRHGSIVCAEVLIPDRVDPRYILGAYASCAESRQTIREQGTGLSVEVTGRLFFR